MFKDAISRAKGFLARRSQAYKQVFNPESVFAQVVLEDLAKFCRANESTFHPDQRQHAALEGRREVWLRICHHTKLDPEQLWKKYGRQDL